MFNWWGKSGMKVDELNLQRQLQMQLIQKQKTDVEGESFLDTLNKLIQDVSETHKESAKLAEDFIKGEPVELHEVMIAAEKAKTSFQLLLEIRNRFIDFYREVLRMQA